MQFCRRLDYKTASIFARAKNARAVKRTFWSECEEGHKFTSFCNYSVLPSLNKAYYYYYYYYYY